MKRLIKAFLFGIAGLFIMITILSLLIPSNVKVARVVVINNTTAGKIYQQTGNLRNWKNWQPMFKPGVAVVNFGNITEGKKASCDIVYNNKTTHLAITAADTSSVKFLLQSKGGNDIENNIILSPLPSSQSVHVEWRTVTKLHWYPWDKFYAIFLDKMSGPGYEAALSNLNDYIEKNP
jgi:hypothetical protein